MAQVLVEGGYSDGTSNGGLRVIRLHKYLWKEGIQMARVTVD